MIKIITSQHNLEIKNVLSLKYSANRKKETRFIVDGKREIEIALKAGLIIEKMFFCAELNTKNNSFLSGVDNNKLIQVSFDIFKKISYKEKPDGFLAIFKNKAYDFNQLIFSKKPIIIVMDAIEKPGNLGAIIRTAYAAGVEAIILNNSQTDVYNPNVIRSSEGAVFLLPIVNQIQEETLSFLKTNKIKTVVTSISKETKPYYKTKLNSGFALILGSEARGVSDYWLENSQEKITIPMINSIDSLNVSVACSIIIFEALRQISVS